MARIAVIPKHMMAKCMERASRVTLATMNDVHVATIPTAVKQRTHVIGLLRRAIPKYPSSGPRERRIDTIDRRLRPINACSDEFARCKIQVSGSAELRASKPLPSTEGPKGNRPTKGTQSCIGNSYGGCIGRWQARAQGQCDTSGRGIRRGSGINRASQRAVGKYLLTELSRCH